MVPALVEMLLDGRRWPSHAGAPGGVVGQVHAPTRPAMHGAVPVAPPAQVQDTVVAVAPVQAAVIGGGQVHTPTHWPSAPQSCCPCCRSGQVHARVMPAGQTLASSGGGGGPQAIASDASDATKVQRMETP